MARRGHSTTPGSQSARSGVWTDRAEAHLVALVCSAPPEDRKVWSLHLYLHPNMPKAIVTFHKLVQDSQNMATEKPDENHMFSRAFFTLQIGSQTYPDMSVTIRQPYGTEYTTEPIGVEPPIGGYKGNWNHSEFSDAIEDYYRGLIGQQGRMISFGPNVRNIRMRNNTIGLQKTYEINIPE